MTYKKKPEFPKKKEPKKKKYYEIKNGMRSGLEEGMQEYFDDEKVEALYESVSIPYTQPAKQRKYTPDFKLPNGIYIETKGRFVTADRQKHLWIKEQYPDVDIRFVFSNPNAKISKRSNTTYSDWCDKHGFKWAGFNPKTKEGFPQEWLYE